MKKDMQDKINEQLFDYCDLLKAENQELSERVDYSSKRLDEYIIILEAMAEKIS